MESKCQDEALRIALDESESVHFTHAQRHIFANLKADGSLKTFPSCKSIVIGALSENNALGFNEFKL